MKKLLKKQIIISFIFIKLVIIFVVILFDNSRNERPVECSKQKHTDLLIFRLGDDLNEHILILELFKIASALDIRLFIVQPQRIYKYLKEV
jgi:hypothetical protein